MRKNLSRIIFNGLLLALLALSVATPALAFDGREGDNLVIGADEVVNDDLYVGADSFTLDGTVKGDVIAAGRIITINGTIEGDLIAAAQAVIVNGTVTDDVRVAAGALQVGEKAKIGGDIAAVGASLEARQGSSVGQDAIFGGGQALLAGEIARNVLIAGGGLEIRGTIGGNVNASTGDAEQSGPGPMVFMPNSPISLPNVQPGIKIDPAAKIEGKLEYVSKKDVNFPSGVIAGAVKRIEPVVDPATVVKQPTLAEQLVTGTLNLFRNMITLFVLGLVLVWLFPKFVQSTSERVRSAPLPSLGWGFVSWAAFIFALLFILVALLFGGILFGVLTLSGLSAAVIWLGILSMFTLSIGFWLAFAFIAKIVVALLGGKLILKQIKPEWAEHKVWPLLLGVVIFAILAAIPYLGGLFSFCVALFGLGALWLSGRDLLKNGRAVE